MYSITPQAWQVVPNLLDCLAIAMRGQLCFATEPEHEMLDPTRAQCVS